MQAMPAGVRPQVLAKVAGFYVLEDSPVGTLDRDDVLQIVIRKHVMHDRRGAKRPQREDLPTSAAHLALPAPGDAGPPLRSATAGGKVSHQDQLRKIKRVRLGEEDVSSSSSSSSEGTEESSSTSDEEPDDGSSGSSSSSSEGEAVEGSSSSSSEEETDTSSSEEESGEARAGRCASLSNIGLRNGQSASQLVGLSPASPAMLQVPPGSSTFCLYGCRRLSGPCPCQRWPGFHVAKVPVSLSAFVPHNPHTATSPAGGADLGCQRSQPQCAPQGRQTAAEAHGHPGRPWLCKRQGDGGWPDQEAQPSCCDSRQAGGMPKVPSARLCGTRHTLACGSKAPGGWAWQAGRQPDTGRNPHASPPRRAPRRGRRLAVPPPGMLGRISRGGQGQFDCEG